MASAAQGSGDVSLRIEICCDQCHREPNPCHVIDVFIEMEPKPNTETPFYLCVPCWLRDDWGPGGRANGRMVEVHPRESVVVVPP